ncbi:MAG: FkbM family methyltransferase [Sedimentisphaerales bacterium]|jgi:FkbM family methyltransferase|nr:FkbM family methyltransferase [Sedimentisphaerales bacterium]HNY79979.1 FkbM family methyltransferase [Sedimentisphaerales bacterium]HOC64919.1 FkbM family methyltransferase [Sedimentisphaerales bacterium]HOH65005.1 FkbM family methyltransferase [Sedimentisphaerales bacterium]HPY50048.1 FkbM family methyltransferase [Sedimentisphaerales bacterium]
MNKMMRKALRACHLYDVVVDLKHWLTGTEAQYAKFYSQFVRPNDLCFDVGANVGRRTQVLLRLGARVVAVEPQEQCMARLRRRFSVNDKVMLIQTAVGAKAGQAQMQLCDSHSLSSLSTGWIERVRASGRYAQCTWGKTVTIDVTTLDALISQYGCPAFLKLDVEGYEHEALKGLSRPVPAVCFEFTPEFVESTRNCVDHLSGIGPAQFNYCLEGTPTTLGLAQWVSRPEMDSVLRTLCTQKQAGDIYVRFAS